MQTTYTAQQLAAIMAISGLAPMTVRRIRRGLPVKPASLTRWTRAIEVLALAPEASSVVAR